MSLRFSRPLPVEDISREHAVEGCDLLKLDCEGAEFEILEEAEAVLPKIRRIRMEYHRGETLSAFLRERGYACEVVPSRRHPDRGHLFAERR